MTDNVNKHTPAKRRGNEEFYKKIWLSLFEWKILSSCEESDVDFFGASALLKSALRQFEKLKKRLTDSQNVVETLKFELKKTKLENENFTQKLKDLKTTDCTHCQCLKSIQSYSEGCTWNSECHPLSSKRSKEYNLNLGNLPLKNQSSELSNQKSILPVPEAHGARGCPGTTDGGGPDLQGQVYVKYPASNVHDTPKLPSLKEEEGTCLPLSEDLVTSEKTILKTPEKEISPHHFFVESSPVLNSQKRAKRFAFSPCMSGSNSKPPNRNARSPSCLISGVGSFEVETLCSKTALSSFSEGKERCVKVNPKKKKKILSLRLKQEQLRGSAQSLLPKSEASSMGGCHQAASGTEKVGNLPNTPPTKVARGRPGAGPSPRDQVSTGLLFVPKSMPAGSEEDDELIIMPSPNSLQSNNALIDVNVSGDPVNTKCDNTTIHEVEEGVCQLESHDKEWHKTREPPEPLMETDTEMTYFVPKNDRSEEEEVEGGGDEVVFSDGNMHNKLSHCAHSDAVGVGFPPRCLLTSFDRVPPKSPSPKFKHQRAAVRKKRDRMQMEGWECKACKKYYDAAGVEVDHHERKGHVNKCSRHRDRYSPRKCTPKGFWDPLFPETPEG